MRCPCCSGTGEIDEQAPVQLTPYALRMYNTVRRAKHGVTKEQLLFGIYGGQDDGGPEWADKSMYVMMKKINKKLATAGVRIAATTKGRGSVYKIITL